MKTKGILLLALLLLLFSCKHPSENRNVIFQTSTINALLKGNYDGEFSYGALKKRGDFGIGTFNKLDGEMIALDGDFYQIKSDGIAYPVKDDEKTPFAMVTWFHTDISTTLKDTIDYYQLMSYLDSLIPTPNIFYAFKIQGEFDYVKTRSVPKQSKPYRPLLKVVENQPTFTFHKIKGTLIGFRFPEYMKGINVAGYHFHFITADRSRGGHLLDCKGLSVSILIDSIHDFQLELPKTREFYKVNLDDSKKNEIEKVEK